MIRDRYTLLLATIVVLLSLWLSSCIHTTTAVKTSTGRVVEITQSKNSTITITTCAEKEVIHSEQRNVGIIESFGHIIIENTKSIFTAVAGIFRPTKEL